MVMKELKEPSEVEKCNIQLLEENEVKTQWQ